MSIKLLLDATAMKWRGGMLLLRINKFLVSLFVELFNEIDLCSSRRIWARILPTQIPTSDIQIQDPLHCSLSILFKVNKKKNQVFWILFAYPSSGAKWTPESSKSVRSMSLDIQILDSAISWWSKHLQTPTNQFLLGFKYSTPLN